MWSNSSLQLSINKASAGIPGTNLDIELQEDRSHLWEMWGEQHDQSLENMICDKAWKNKAREEITELEHDNSFQIHERFFQKNKEITCSW